MSAYCAQHIPVHNIPAHVIVVRDGVPTAPGYLQAGDQLSVTQAFTFSYRRNRYTVQYGNFELACHRLALSPSPQTRRTSALAMVLRSGRIDVRAGPHPLTALVLTPEMLAFATAHGTRFVVVRDAARRSTSAWTLGQPIVAASASDQRLRIDTRITYTAIADRDGLRLDIWPFSLTPFQRPTSAADALPAYWSDGLPCSVGCTAPGAIPGWPLKPFHRQHALRAGINELRPANFHVAVDIQAHNLQPVYAIQSGRAHIRYPNTGDVNVDIGNFYYWHIAPAVRNGQYVTAYRTIIGRVLRGFYHLAFSEVNEGRYLNPLRPGGSLLPYTDTEAPIIGVPRIFSDGRAIVGAFDPQSFVAVRQRSETPVLAPSSLAWRLYDAHGRPLTGLEWAMRGSQNYPPSLKPVIFAPGAANPGFLCWLAHRRCIPNWVYWLAGGLTPPLPLKSLTPGRYRLTIYAWDWKGNTSALDYWFRLPLSKAAGAPAADEFGPLNPAFDYDETGAPIPLPTVSTAGP